MADRTSAYLFAEIFQLLAEHELNEKSKYFWDLSKDYDFQPYQMYCDETLLKLGLALYNNETKEIEYL